MIHAALGRPVPVELTGDPRVRGRVARLAAVSVVALGVVWWLAVTTLDALPAAVAWCLALGWIAMPAALLWSLRDPRARYLLVVPSTLVTVGLLAIGAGWLPPDPVAAAGWLVLLAGVALGGALGLWLWFRVLPVPASLDDPLARGRWALIAVHAGLVVAGIILAATALRSVVP